MQGFPSTLPDDERARMVADMVAKGMPVAEAEGLVSEALAKAKAEGAPTWEQMFDEPVEPDAPQV